MKNKDALAEAKKKVDNLSYIIGEILEGKLSQSKAAEQLKISPQTFGKQISQYFAPYVKSKIISEEEIKKMIHDLSTPIERMTEDIFDLHENERILMLDDEVQEKVIEAAKERLNEREYRVMDKRYGLSNNVPGEKGLTLEIVGKEFGVCRDRISQIQSKSLRKMRTPQIWKEVLPEYQELVEALEDLETMQEKRNKVIRDYENVLSQIRWIQYQEKVYELFQEWSEFEKTKLSAVFTIESIPWLPEKLEKAFSLHGIHTIKDLISISEETASAICRDTETPMPDFIKLCNKTGIFPIFYNREPFPNEFDMPIEYLDLSVRSYNCLHRAGIYTVNDIIKRKGKIKDIRNLGKKSYKEIVTVIWEKYSINLDHVE